MLGHGGPHGGQSLYAGTSSAIFLLYPKEAQQLSEEVLGCKAHNKELRCKPVVGTAFGVCVSPPHLAHPGRKDWETIGCCGLAANLLVFYRGRDVAFLSWEAASTPPPPAVLRPV